MNESNHMLEMWEMGRTRLTALLSAVNDAALAKKLRPGSNSVGWLLRHVGEVEQLFAKNVFGLEVQVKAYTLAGTPPRASHETAADLLAFLEQSAERLREAIARQDDESWGSPVTTAEFGTVTKREALARVMTHTAYHAGQLGLALKYGS